MSAWGTLLPSAMVGTDRQSTWTAAVPGVVGQLLSDVAAANADPAQRLLRSAAAIAVCSMAGATRHRAGTAPDEPAGMDTAPALSDPALLSHMAWSLRSGPPRLQHIALQRLAKAGWRLPTALLPTALDLGRRSIALRGPVGGVLGQRGAWLARHHNEWRYAIGVAVDADDEAVWSHGSVEQRHALLRKQRTRDAGAARQRVSAELPALSARERADLMLVLADGLGVDDEPLLVAALEDRSKEVRQAALGLLVRLPDGAFAQRASARVAPLLKQERVLLRTRWAIDAPMQSDAAWERDAVELDKPKQESLGERGWWLYQLVRQVPLTWWTTHTGMAPGDLLQWATKGDWTEALLRGWRDVLLSAPDVAWCEALLDGWPWKGLSDDPSRFVALLPLHNRERHWQRQLHGGGTALGAVVQQLLAACPPGETVSLALSQSLVTLMRSALADPNIAYDYALRSALPDLCCALHLDALDPIADMARREDATPAHIEAQHTVTQVVAALRAFHQLPKP